MKDSLQFAAEHIITIYIFKDWRHYTSSIQRIAYLIDNYGRGDYVQRGDIENDSNTNIGNKIFSLFLGLSDSRVKVIIRLTPCIDKNLTYMQVSQIEMQYVGRRLIRQFVSPSLVMTTATCSSSSGGKKYHRRRKRGSGIQKKLVKTSSQRAIEKFKKRGTI